MAIAGAIVLLVILVVLGGYFFYRSLPGNSEVLVPNQSGAQPESSSPGTAAEDFKALHIRVVGEASDVLVRVPGGDVLIDTTMTKGEYVSYDEPRMDVTLGTPSAVEVHVNGEPKDVSQEEPGYTFTVEAE
ncbi:RodZ domain-containing protein [Thermobifida cellulosilytica]|uniref:Cytoskeleton protein RodZ-like C-terminal domain-containing protein n=1 Tax=Thermobifida cellulosilytica TB100 TaxID=665004 RepID=A0A147KLP2_THECS|nr:RodZ domain-containing protein [Thermobifida cellulosilytica]KUP98173.1 hypothetical protein AC529_03225 [Thermobifida cellulosilytica TB100]